MVQRLCVSCPPVHLSPGHAHLGPGNVAVFGNRLFADVTKLRGGTPGLEWAPNPMASVLTGKGRGRSRDTDTQEGRSCGDTDEEGGDAVTNRGTPGTTRSRKRQGRILPSSLRRGAVLSAP